MLEVSRSSPGDRGAERFEAALAHAIQARLHPTNPGVALHLQHLSRPHTAVQVRFVCAETINGFSDA